MSIKDFFSTKAIQFKEVHPVVLSILTTVSAEFLFQHFLPDSRLSVTFGRMIIVFLSLFIIQSYAYLSLVRYRPSFKDLLLLHFLLISSILILWFGKILSIALSQYLTQFDTFKDITPQILHYAIPFACGALLISAVKGLNYGLVFSVCFSIIVGFYLPQDILIIPFVLVTSLIASLSLENFRSRATYLRVGFKVGLIAVPFSLVSLVFSGDASLVSISFRIFFSLLGGFLAVIIAAGLTPLLEFLGGYVTDLRLIEMSTLDHPLLKNLSIQAPGTWNHSMVIGMMVESAAGEIGANPVLARVGAYFHDIGKTKKPLYFVENQSGGVNRHDKLSPSMSALIIRSHVKDGVDMALEHRVPKAIIDLIEQHHGTSLIEYFYNKACKEAEESDENTEVDESLYRYPGPKPQTREAGILMLADIIESSSRVLPDFSPDRIQMHVQKIVNRVFASGQLEQSDLTLRDLHRIARSFTRVLNSIHHQRIAYDDPTDSNTEEKQLKRQSNAVKVESKSNGKKVANINKQSSQEGEAKEGNSKKDNKESLKRLGLEELS